MGRHLTGALAARGHRILATDLDAEALERQAAEQGWPTDRVARRALDVRSESDWDAAVDRLVSEHGSIDVLLNVAGYLHPAWIVDTTARDVDLHFDVNVKGVVLGTRAAARRMVAAGRGHIVNFGSLASLAPVPGLSLYSASKFAVRGFSLAAATELGRRGVAVTVVMPDAVQTPMLDKQVDHRQAALTFSGARALTVDEVARLVLDEVLVRRPMEITIPTGRGVLARIANTAPGLSRLLAPALEKKGMRAQRRIRRDGGDRS